MSTWSFPQLHSSHSYIQPRFFYTVSFLPFLFPSASVRADFRSTYTLETHSSRLTFFPLFTLYPFFFKALISQSISSSSLPFPFLPSSPIHLAPKGSSFLLVGICLCLCRLHSVELTTFSNDPVESTFGFHSFAFSPALL